MDPRPIQDLLAEIGIDAPTCRSVLLVDDEFEVLAVLEALLDDDWDVYTAQSGQAALEILRENASIDLVITDQRMPEMTGVELLQALSDSHPDLYRMVLTAYSDVDPIVAAINQGKVDQFILKPWDPEAMRSLVSEGLAVCERRSAMRSIVSHLSQNHQRQSAALAELKTNQGADRAKDWLGVIDAMGTAVAGELEQLLGPASTASAGIEPNSTARAALRRARTLCEDLGRMAAARQEDAKTSLPPRKLISDAVRLLMDDDSGHNNPVHVDIDPSVESLTVSVDAMRQAILSMLRNAVRASDSGVPIQVRVRREHGGLIAIEVHDQGAGMSIEATQHAAEPFFSEFSPPSSGLGLSLCRLVSELHGGRMALLDNEPSGVIAQLWLREESP